MEPMVVFGAGIVAYCSYRAVLDAVRELREERRGELVEAACEKVKFAGQESTAGDYVVGKEKLSKILASRSSKRFKTLSAPRSLAGSGTVCLQEFPRARRLCEGQNS